MLPRATGRVSRRLFHIGAILLPIAFFLLATDPDAYAAEDPSAAPFVTGEPSATPPEPSATPPEPSATPPEPSATPPEPSATPPETPQLSEEPSAEPSETPQLSAAPSEEASATPLLTPQPSPEPSETPQLSEEPSAEASETPQLSAAPSEEASPTPVLTPQPSPEPSAEPDPDADDDGVADTIDVGDGAFDDGQGTSGSIVTTAGHPVTVDADPDGVRIVVGGAGSVKAVFQVCGFTLQLLPGSDVVVGCGSITARVITGAADLVLGNGLTIVSVPSGVTAIVDEEPDGSFSVQHVDGTEPIEITVDGVPGTVQPGTTSAIEAWNFTGFTSPVDNLPTRNVAKAGRAIPLKWRLVGADGQPVTDLSAAIVSVRGTACSAGTSPDLVEETYAGGSGLQNLGNGYYQLNWKSPSSYARSCKVLRLDIGDGVLHEALFEFTR